MSKSKRVLFLCLFLVSGFCGLVYEIVWGRLLSFVFGGTTFAVTTVLACFMGGLAAGSWLGGCLGRNVRNPVRAYGFIEISIGLYCLFIPALMHLALPLYRVLAETSGQSFVLLTLARILVSALILVIPACLMGSTLPLLSKAFTRHSDELGGSVALLYGINTAGAFAGCVSVGCFLLPVFGLSRCILLAAALNILAGAVAVIGIGKGTGSKETLIEGDNGNKVQPGESVASGSLYPPAVLLSCAVCGFVAMGYQVAWIRALILVMGASTYAFSIIVACFIFGIAVGSLLISKTIDRISRPVTWAGVLAGTIGLSSIIAVPCFERMVGFVAKLSQSGNSGFFRILGLETLYMFGLLIVPTLCMGALLPLFCRIYRELRVRKLEGKAAQAFVSSDVGAVYASNTAGSVLGIVITGFVLIPCVHLGMQRSIISLSVLSVVVGSLLLVADNFFSRKLVLSTLVAVSAACISSVFPGGAWSKKDLLSAPYLGHTVDRSEEIIFYEEGVDCTVSVSLTGKNNRTLRINGKPDASSRIDDRCTQVLMGQIPLFLRPGSSDVCVIGLGSGITADSVLAHPVKSVDVAEISSSVIRAAEYFSQANNNVLKNARLKVCHEDGRNFLLLGKKKYDIIISEPSNVWISGIANLYSREFLETARRNLKPGGLYCFWIHSYAMRSEDFTAVIGTMMTVFPHAQLWSMTFGDYLVLGSESPVSIDLESCGRTFGRPEVKDMMKSIGIDDPIQLAYYYVADGKQLAPLVSGQRILVDDLPYLEFSAPQYLLKSEAMRIVGTILSAEGEPDLTGGNTSTLNSGFIERIRKGRASRRCLNETVRAANSGEGMQVLKNFLLAAQYAPDDRRVLYVIENFFEEKIANVDPKTRAVMEEYYARIVSAAPRIRTIRRD